MGLSGTRLGSRQIVSHGHILVNGKRVDIPSIRMRIGDKIEIREGSQGKPLFTNIEERIKNINVPTWVKFDSVKKVGEIVGVPQYVQNDNMFDLNAVIEFYSR
jgi:small subunit ribosomal protein S4